MNVSIRKIKMTSVKGIKTKRKARKSQKLLTEYKNEKQLSYL